MRNKNFVTGKSKLVTNQQTISEEKSGNMRNKIYFIGFSTLFILMIFLVGANVNYLHNSIASNYTAGETIRGNFNLRLSNHPSDAMLTSNFAGEITLLDLIKNQSGLIEGRDYNCSTIGCSNDYSSLGEITNMQITGANPEFAGFKIAGNGVDITDAKIRISSNAPASCSANLYVDLLADGQDLMTSTLSSTESCGVRHTGCYTQSNTALATIVTGREYCEKINIPAGPSFILGAEIKRGSTDSNLTMKLYDFSSPATALGSCKLPQSENNPNLQELSCITNYSAHETKEYYVCISTSLNNGYQIGQETTAPTCGTAQGFGTLNSDFDLFAETTKYAANPIITINQSSYKKAFNLNLTNVLDDYIQNIYDRNCQDDCFIPLKISGQSQTVSFNDIGLNYDIFGAPRPAIEQIDKLSYDAPRITSNNLTLDISKASFVIPIPTNQNKFELSIDGDELFEKPISIARTFVFDVNPKSVAFGQNVRFNATSAVKITRTIWNFADGTPVQTINGTSVFHVFTNDEPYFDINVTAISNQTQATKQFRIYVGSPKEIANLTIREYKKRLANITTQINSYPSWVIPIIQNKIAVSNLTAYLNYLENSYNNASTEEEYQSIMLDLISLNVPAYISSTQSADNLPLSVGYENINTQYIKEIENKNLNNQNLADQIVAWMGDNFNAEISFRKVTSFSDFTSEDIGTIFTIKTNPLTKTSTKSYLIFGQDVENSGVYKTDYKVSSVTSGVDYIVLDTSTSQTFEFFIKSGITPQILGAYISPSLDVLENIQAPEGECNLNNRCDSGENAEVCPEDCSSSWFKFAVFGWIALVIFALIVYIILQEWYKKNYQRTLFPEINDLYNLVNFIYNARKEGLADSEIRSKLRQQQWSNERIAYAFKKIDGKRLGMLEIPIFRRKEQKEIVQQIANRQPKGQLDARFIKRPNY